MSDDELLQVIISPWGARWKCRCCIFPPHGVKGCVFLGKKNQRGMLEVWLPEILGMEIFLTGGIMKER